MKNWPKSFNVDGAVAKTSVHIAVTKMETANRAAARLNEVVTISSTGRSR